MELLDPIRKVSKSKRDTVLETASGFILRPANRNYRDISATFVVRASTEAAMLFGIGRLYALRLCRPQLSSDGRILREGDALTESQLQNKLQCHLENERKLPRGCSLHFLFTMNYNQAPWYGRFEVVLLAGEVRPLP
jgi:hypothetical protein